MSQKSNLIVQQLLFFPKNFEVDSRSHSESDFLIDFLDEFQLDNDDHDDYNAH